MPEPSPPTPNAGQAETEAVRVAVVGGGIGGMTSALKLAQRGYKVTLYEATGTLGGNFSSTFDEKTGLYHDVYPHIFAGWYKNFWALLETDLNLRREDQFKAQPSVKVLDSAQKRPLSEDGTPKYLELTSATTVETALANLKSGVLSPPDMFLFGFSMLDIAGHPRVGSGSEMINKLDVNGFMYSRGYSTEDMALLQDYILKVIWSIPSTATAATSYQDLVKHTLVFPYPTPFAWLLRGSLAERIIQPWREALEAAGCEVRMNAKAVRVALTGPATRVDFEDGSSIEADEVVLAVSGQPLADLVMGGEAGQRIVDRVPHLSQIRNARAEAIPVVDIYFKKKLKDIPSEIVGLRDSEYDLTFIDISQLWIGSPGMADVTVLILAASSGHAIPSEEGHERAWMMIKRLSEYLPGFNPGAAWGDVDSDVCWEKTFYRSNQRSQLFLNDVGSLEWRPVSAYDALPSVVFAGDICRSDVNMATVEASVQTGLMAAQSIWSRKPRGETINLQSHEIYSDTSLLAAKLALLPLAYGAAAWSIIEGSQRSTEKGGAAATNATPQLAYTLILPLAYSVDWLKTAFWLLLSLKPDAAPARAIREMNGVADSDRAIPLSGAMLATAGQVFQAITDRMPVDGPPASPSPTVSAAGAQAVVALSNLAGLAWGAFKTYAASQGPALRQGPDAATPYHRRWRVKD